MEERNKPKYRAIRWVVGLILLMPYMAAYSLIERRIPGRRKWVVVFLGGLGLYMLEMAGLYKVALINAFAITNSPPVPQALIGWVLIYTLSWAVLLVAVIVYEWMSLPAEEKTRW